MRMLERRRSFAVNLLIAAVLLLAGLPAGLPTAHAASANVVISQIYGGGGKNGATYTHDFVELFNRGSSSVNLKDWSLQYTSATGTGNFGSSPDLITPLPEMMLAPGQYLLIAEASNAAVGAPLPAPDVTDATPIAMAAGAGKVALVNTTAPLGCNGGSAPCNAAQLAQIVDLVGYGTGAGGANFFEGAGAASTLSSTTAALRANGGCTDTDNNGADFTAAMPTPRNTASPLHSCSADQPPSVSSTTPTSGATGVALDANISVTFSEAVDVIGTWFTIVCGTSGAHSATVSGGPTTFTLDPTTDFVPGESCTVTVVAAQVKDQDTDDPPDFMAGNSTLTFSTSAPPTVSCAASPNVLWPPNHKMVPVTLTVTVHGTMSGPTSWKLISVTSNEPDNGNGDGDTSNDIQGWTIGTPDASGELRAERSGAGSGRVYTFVIEGKDQQGTASTCTTTVVVPHDQGNGAVKVGRRPAQAGPPALAASVAARMGCGPIQRVEFGILSRPFDNARVTVVAPAGGPQGQTAGFVYVPPSNTTEVSFTIERIVPQGGATVAPIVVTDGCGARPTFIGGGADAFK